jgi:hypothetical protein
MFLRSCVLLAAAATLAPAAIIFSEDFNNVAGLTGAGWVIRNNSSPAGSTSWIQGDGNTFPAFAGAPNAYAAADVNSTGATGTISTWLITPQVTIDNNSVLSFRTRTVNPATNADRMEVRFSLSGTDVGGTATSVGDFIVLGFTINPALSLVDYPTDWTEVLMSFAGLPGPTNVHVGFRYFVTDAGTSAKNGDYIGIDSFQLDDGVSNPVPEPSTFVMMAAPLALFCCFRRRA